MLVIVTLLALVTRYCQGMSLTAVLQCCRLTSIPRGLCTGARAAAWSAVPRSRAGSGGTSGTRARAPGPAATTRRPASSSGPGWAWWGRARPGLKRKMLIEMSSIIL